METAPHGLKKRLVALVLSLLLLVTCLPEGAYTYMVFLTDSNGQTICFMSDFTVSSAATSTATYWTVQDPSGSKLGENVQKAVESVSETASAVEQSAWSWLGNLFGE